MNDTDGLLDLLWGAADRISVIAVLLAAIWAILTRRLVPGWVLDSVEKDKERYRAIAERTLGTADRAVTVAEKTAVIAERLP